MKTLSKALLVALIAVPMFAPITATSSFARKVSNNTAASLLTNCLLASDGSTILSKPTGRMVKCCSKSLGFCVICPTDGKKRCTKRAYSSRPTIGLKDTAPTTGDVAAPPKTSKRRVRPTLFQGMRQVAIQ